MKHAAICHSPLLVAILSLILNHLAFGIPLALYTCMQRHLSTAIGSLDRDLECLPINPGLLMSGPPLPLDPQGSSHSPASPRWVFSGNLLGMRRIAGKDTMRQSCGYTGLGHYCGNKIQFISRYGDRNDYCLNGKRITLCDDGTVKNATVEEVAQLESHILNEYASYLEWHSKTSLVRGMAVLPLEYPLPLKLVS